MRIVFVTTNAGKIEEAVRLGKEYGIEVLSNTYDAYEPRSTDPVEIAEASAKDAYDFIGKPLIVEDSGFFIDALHGFPGTYSAYVFKTIGLEGMMKVMEGVENRRASMRSAVAYTDGEDLVSFAGRVDGAVPERKGGDRGFGYDPIFIPDGCDATFAEDPKYKSKISHRAQSLRAFFEWFAER